MQYSVSFCTMNQKLVIIFAFVSAFHWVVNGANLDLAPQAEWPEPNDEVPPVNALRCFYIFDNGIEMRTDCALTGILHIKINMKYIPRL